MVVNTCFNIQYLIYIMAVYYIINDVELYNDFIRKCLLYGINTEIMRLLLGSYGIWRSFFVSHDRKILLFVCLMVFSATFNNISVISYLSVFFIDGGNREYPKKTHRPVSSHWQTLLHNAVHLALIEIQTHQWW